MGPGKGLIFSALGLMKDAAVVEHERVGERFHRIVVEGTALVGADWRAGDKLLVLTPTREVRAYTPWQWDGERGRAALLLYEHGDGPGARWGRDCKVGDACRLMGPGRSLRVPAGRSLVLFGDETSLAVARALQSTRQPLATVIEAEAPREVEVASEALGLVGVVTVARRAGGAHLEEVVLAVRRALGREPGSELLLTGCVQSMAALRKLVIKPSGQRAYWAEGRSGLD